MKVLTVLETIQEGVALQCPPYMPSYLSSTPLRGSTPPASPKPIRYQNQNMMSGMRSPDVLSRMSHTSLQSCRDSELGSNDRPQYHGGSNVFTRATEKLGNWLINRNSNMDSNSAINIQGRASFSGPLSRKSSSGGMEDHNESITSDSLRDLYGGDTTPVATHRGIHVSPLRLSPVTETLCSQSAPVNIDNFFSLSSHRIPHQSRKGGTHVHKDLEELKEDERNHELNSLNQSPSVQPQLRFCVTPIPTRYSRQTSYRDTEPTVSTTIDDCIEMNLQELNSDKDTPSVRENDGMRVRWIDNIEQINCNQDNVFGGPNPARTGSFGASTDLIKASNLMISNNHPIISRLIHQKDTSDNPDEYRSKFAEDRIDSRTLPLPTVMLTSATAPELFSDTVNGVHHGSSEGSLEYEQPESHQCTVNSLTPLLLSDSTSTDILETC